MVRLFAFMVPWHSIVTGRELSSAKSRTKLTYVMTYLPFYQLAVALKKSEQASGCWVFRTMLKAGLLCCT